MPRLDETTARVLKEEIRKEAHATYVYRLLETNGPVPYNVSVTYEPREGRSTASTVPLPYAAPHYAFALFEALVHHLVTPLDLPYVLEDLCVCN